MMMTKDKDERFDAMESLLSSQFTLEEGYKLINTMVANSEKPKDVDELGLVCGVMQVNDEVEVIVRFKDYLEQTTKSEYLSQYHEIDS